MTRVPLKIIQQHPELYQTWLTSLRSNSNLWVFLNDLNEVILFDMNQWRQQNEHC